MYVLLKSALFEYEILFTIPCAFDRVYMYTQEKNEPISLTIRRFINSLWGKHIFDFLFTYPQTTILKSRKRIPVMNC